MLNLIKQKLLKLMIKLDSSPPAQTSVLAARALTTAYHSQQSNTPFHLADDEQLLFTCIQLFIANMVLKLKNLRSFFVEVPEI